MAKLNGKVAVVTGGSSGIGLAMAKRFVEEGAYVFIVGRRQDALDSAVKQIGKNVKGVRADVSNLDDLDRLYKDVASTKGKLDVVVANAGIVEIKSRHPRSRPSTLTRHSILTPVACGSPFRRLYRS